MNKNKDELSLGIINPGAMGISVAATMLNSGYEVLWASAGRSAESKARAAEHGLVDVEEMGALYGRSSLIVSVCPPHAAEDVADQAIAGGFQGLFLDANAIAVERAERIGRKMAAAGNSFVDGGIIGGPAWQPGRTWLYLSGADAEQALPFFAAGPLETEICGVEIGQASALKMMFASYTKGMTALKALTLGGADALGVRPALEKQWERYWPGFTEETQMGMRRVTAKAWRFEGEMHEIGGTLEAVGLPGGFHEAAAEIYGRLAGFKDAGEMPELEKVLMALAQSEV